jgi:hypothetical protein
MGVMTTVRAREWDDTTWDDPSPEELYDLIADLGLTLRRPWRPWRGDQP